MKTITQYIKEASHWNWEDEANEDGKIELTTTIGNYGESEVDWELEQLSDEGDYWEVKATVVRTDVPRKFKKGYEIEYELYKDTDPYDLESDLLNAVEDDRQGAWSSGH